MNTLSREFISAFIEGTKKTLSTQCGLEVTVQKPFLKGTHPESEISIMGIIGMISPQFKGNIHLAFPEKVFLAVMNKMLAENFLEITDELSSGAAELLNIIYGSAKTVLNIHGYQIKSAIPTVIQGKVIVSKSVGSSPTLVLPFKGDFGEFFLEITEQQTNDDFLPAH